MHFRMFAEQIGIEEAGEDASIPCVVETVLCQHRHAALQ